MIPRPSPQQPPDAAAWTAKYGTTPFVLTATDAEIAAAVELCEEDWSTLDTDEVHGIHANLDCVCSGVGMRHRLPEDTLVFFDHVLRRFIAYPKQPS
jgi:hypothetical protein